MTKREPKIELLKGDITESNSQCIVNTANDRLIFGSGLPGAIKAKGGGGIVEECSKFGTLQVGEAVVTSAGKLKANYIIHTVVSKYDDFLEKENIGKALISALRLANDLKIKSIAIPDMSMGIVRFPPEECAREMFKIIQRFVEVENSSLELIEIFLWDVETLRIYKSIYREIFSQDSK
mgnify:CR=1 FL=1